MGTILRVRHPALSDREKLLRTMSRYDWKPVLAGKSMGVSSSTIMQALKRLALDVVEQKKAEGKLLSSWSQSL